MLHRLRLRRLPMVCAVRCPGWRLLPPNPQRRQRRMLTGLRPRHHLRLTMCVAKYPTLLLLCLLTLRLRKALRRRRLQRLIVLQHRSGCFRWWMHCLIRWWTA